MEDKKLICRLLIPALRATRHFNDLIALEFDEKTETVKAEFASGGVKTANVAADSGYMMIRDILKQME